MGLAFFGVPYTYANTQNFAYLVYLGFFFAQTLFQYTYLRNFKSNFTAETALVCGRRPHYSTLARSFLVMQEARVCIFSSLSLAQQDTSFSRLNNGLVAGLQLLVQSFTPALISLWYNVASSANKQFSVSHLDLRLKPLVVQKILTYTLNKQRSNAGFSTTRIFAKKTYGVFGARQKVIKSKLVHYLFSHKSTAHLRSFLNIGNVTTGANLLPRTGIFHTPFFLTDAYSLLRTHYTADSGRGSHVIRDSGFFFNLGDASLASTFLSYYSSFFYGLLSPITSTEVVAALPQSPLSKLSERSAVQVTPFPVAATGDIVSHKRTIRKKAGLRSVSDAGNMISDSDDASSDVLNRVTADSSALTGLDTLPHPSRYQELARLATSRRNGNASRNFGFFSSQASAETYDAPVFQMKPGYLGL
jgi:hypothetical protein